MYKLLLFVASCIFAVNSSEIISRSEWGARAPISRARLPINPPPFVVIHHSDGSACETLRTCKTRVKQIQNFHMGAERRWKDIGYNFLIGGDGNIYEGRGWGWKGAHVPKYNSKSIGICLIGNFMHQNPPQVQLDALEELIKYGKNHDYIDFNYHLIGHRQGKQTDCPGDKLFNIIKKWSNFDETIVP